MAAAVLSDNPPAAVLGLKFTLALSLSRSAANHLNLDGAQHELNE
jgi:hypothetical protein